MSWYRYQIKNLKDYDLLRVLIDTVDNMQGQVGGMGKEMKIGRKGRRKGLEIKMW